VIEQVPTSGVKRNVGALVVKVVGRVEAGRIVTWGGRRPGAGRPISCHCARCVWRRAKRHDQQRASRRQLVGSSTTKKRKP